MRLPIEAKGDRELVERLSKLPIDQQPFWLINWRALEEHRKNPQTFDQKPNVFIDPMVNSNQQQSTQRIPQAQQSTSQQQPNSQQQPTSQQQTTLQNMQEQQLMLQQQQQSLLQREQELARERQKFMELQQQYLLQQNNQLGNRNGLEPVAQPAANAPNAESNVQIASRIAPVNNEGRLYSMHSHHHHSNKPRTPSIDN